MSQFEVENSAETQLTMAMNQGLLPPHSLELNSGNISVNWKKFKQRYLNYEIATGINEKNDATRVATFLTVVGNEALDVYDTLIWDSAGDDKKINKVIEKFDEYCEPKKNVSYERYVFFSRAQESNETIDQYVTTLKKLCETCEFGTLKNSLIKDRIVLGVNNQRTRERLLREPDLTLEKAWELVRAAETTEKHLKDMQNESVHSIKNGKKHRMRKYNQEQQPKSSQHEKSNQSSVFDCRNCGTKHGKKECPAYGKTCHNCQKPNHYKKMCKSKKRVHHLEHEENPYLEETLFVGAVTTGV